MGDTSEGSAPKRTHRAPAGEGDKLRVQLLDAAERQIAADGIPGLSLRQVARECGVSATSVYLHFDNKEDLLIAVCSRRFIDLGERLRAIIDGPGTVVEQLRACALEYIGWGLGNVEQYLAFFAALPLKVALQRQNPDELGLEGLALIAQLVERGQHEGSLRGGDPALIALSLWSMVHGAVGIIHHAEPIAPASDDEQIAVTVDMIFEGILA